MILTTNRLALVFSLFLSFQFAIAQEESGGSFSGGFETNGGLFLRDPKIGAAGTPQYDKQLFGSESWLDLNYNISGFDIGARFDLFNNSALLNPQSSYTDVGIGKYYLRKTIHKLEISGGHIYDQLGSGIIYRAYEERTQLIDNALFGARLKYNLNKDWNVRVFTGKQRDLFSTQASILKGGAIEGFIAGKEGSTFSTAPGIGFINRTLADAQMDQLVSIIKGYRNSDQIKPTFNTNAFSIWNTLTWKWLNWYIEGAYKPEDVIYDPAAEYKTGTGEINTGKLIKADGSVLYTNVGISVGKVGITAELKRTENFDFRADPLLGQNKGLITFIPPMSRTNSYRLTALYVPATQFLSEMAFQLDVKYAIGNRWSINANYSDIRDKNFETELYRELLGEVTYKVPGKWQLIGGLQNQLFNEVVYYGKSDVPNVRTLTPYTEFLYKFDRKKSLRVEASYQHSEQDLGSFVFGLVEFGIAPKWLFELSDMYNVKPLKGEKLNYPTAGIVFTENNSRYGLRYVKQVEGVVCSGGICRLEPAFSGFKMSIASSF